MNDTSERVSDRLSDLLTQVGLRITELLEEHGWNQDDLATAVGKSPSVVSRILAAESNITLKTIAEFAEALKGDILIAASTKAPLPATDGGAYIVAYVPHDTAVSVFQRAADSRRAFQDVVAECLTDAPVKLPSRLISELRSLEDPAGIEALVTDAVRAYVETPIATSQCSMGSLWPTPHFHLESGWRLPRLHSQTVLPEESDD